MVIKTRLAGAVRHDKASVHFLDGIGDAKQRVVKRSYFDSNQGNDKPRFLLSKATTSEDALANAKDAAEQIGLEGGIRFSLGPAVDQGWFEDAEVEDDTSWVSVTTAGVGAVKSSYCQ